MGKRNHSSNSLTLPEKLAAAAQAALDKKAEGVVALDVGDTTGYADRFLICSGTHPKHNQAIADAIVDKLAELGEPPLSKEGYEPANWILIDANDIVIHIFDSESRRYYDLEHLWHDAPREEFGEEPALEAARTRRA